MGKKISNCEYCGDYLGTTIDKWPGEPTTCGKRECERWAYEEVQAAREEAHEELDRMLGYD